MATRFYAGTDGRIRTGTNVVMAGITKWSFRRSAKAVAVTHYESAADSNGNVHEELLIASGGSASSAKVGIVSNSVAIEGFFNSDTTSGTLVSGGLGIGSSVTALDLYHSKSEPFGYSNLAGVVTEFEDTSDLNSDRANTFRATVQLTGVPAAPSATMA